MNLYYVYILSNKINGPIYIGVTSDLISRVYCHKNNLVDGFTRKYHIHNLVYYEVFNDVVEAITREKRMKKWKREWKVELIERNNPSWEDLYDHLIR